MIAHHARATDHVRFGVVRRAAEPADWLRHARRGAPVQAVVPALDLRTAAALWCRTAAERRRLAALGFAPERIAVRRLTVR